MFDGLTKYKFNKMKETLLNGKFEFFIERVSSPLSLIVLPNGNLVCGTECMVKLLNEELKVMKTKCTEGHGYCALNRRNQIYVSISQKNIIILFDLNLNELKRFGSPGSENNQFNWPSGLFCRDDYLYICDYANQRIQILTLDFEYVNTIQTDGNTPRIIQISETSIGVSCNEVTLFYDLKTRILKYKYNYGTFNISYIDSIFCSSNYQKRKFYFFNSDGNFIEEIPINKNICYHMSWTSGSLCKYKDNLFMITKSPNLLRFIQE